MDDKEICCENCEHFNRYYSKGAYKFHPLQSGFCMRKKGYPQCNCEQPACKFW